MTNHAIYQPKGKAGEYAPWACNFVVGCPNDCQYCYCKAYPLGKVWSTEQRLKKCFKDEKHALQVFESELSFNIVELQKHGLFFTFTSDPFAERFRDLHSAAWGIAVHKYQVPVVVLTKLAGWVDDFLWWMNHSNSDNASLEWRKEVCFGFTLTGHDELEPGASNNAERIEAMRKLKDNGFRTFASIEPIIDFESSLDMIKQTIGFCDLYKVGTESGNKYDRRKAFEFISDAHFLTYQYDNKVYFKDSILKAAFIERRVANNLQNCVERGFNMFR